jgi:hypothetical protein
MPEARIYPWTFHLHEPIVPFLLGSSGWIFCPLQLKKNSDKWLVSDSLLDIQHPYKPEAVSCVLSTPSYHSSFSNGEEQSGGGNSLLPSRAVKDGGLFLSSMSF